MPAVSPTWRQMTFADIDIVTGSVESADGPLRCASPAGPLTAKSGPEAAPASPSRRRAKGKASSMSDICGPSGSGSSASADLQPSLESKLRDRLGTGGLTLYVETWKVKATPARRRYLALVLSGRRTCASDYSGWPPRSATRDWKAGDSHQHGKNARPLNEVAMLAGWATPVATDANAARNETAGRTPGGNHHPGQTLCDQIRGLTPAPWPTVKSSDAARAYGPQGAAAEFARSGTDSDLPTVAHLALGTTSNGSSVETGKPGQLNPAFSLWLQGFPAAWGKSAPREMPSSRKSRPRS